MKEASIQKQPIIFWEGQKYIYDKRYLDFNWWLTESKDSRSNSRSLSFYIDGLNSIFLLEIMTFMKYLSYHFKLLLKSLFKTWQPQLMTALRILWCEPFPYIIKHDVLCLNWHSIKPYRKPRLPIWKPTMETCLLQKRTQLYTWQSFERYHKHQSHTTMK